MINNRNVNEQYLPTHIRHLHHALPRVRSGSSLPSARPSKRQRTSSVVSSNHYVLRLSTDEAMSCPVPDCPAYSTRHDVLRRHFCIRHQLVQFDIVGPSQFVPCPRCGLLISSLNPSHFKTSFCIKQSERRRQLLDAQHPALESPPFTIGDKPIEYVDTFRYLGRILSSDDSDDMAAFTRLEKAKKVWGRFHNLLRKDGASVATMGRFYRTIIQQTLLFGSSTWVLSQRSLQRLERFHARCARAMAHRPIQHRPNGSWITPPTAEVLEACHLQPLSVYIDRRRHTLFEHYARTDSRMYEQCSAMTDTRLRVLAWWNLSMN